MYIITAFKKEKLGLKKLIIKLGTVNTCMTCYESRRYLFVRRTLFQRILIIIKAIFKIATL